MNPSDGRPNRDDNLKKNVQSEQKTRRRKRTCRQTKHTHARAQKQKTNNEKSHRNQRQTKKNKIKNKSGTSRAPLSAHGRTDETNEWMNEWMHRMTIHSHKRKRRKIQPADERWRWSDGSPSALMGRRHFQRFPDGGKKKKQPKQNGR